MTRHKRNLGLIGGTFDPIHIGHLVIADRAMEQLELDALIFLPAGSPPHKRERQHTEPDHRIEMTRLAIEGRTEFSISELDVRPDRPSYTVDLLGEIQAENPDASLTFIIGGDSLRDFPTWHDPGGIIRIARLAVADRPDVEIPESVFDDVPGLKEAVVSIRSPLLEISGTELRRRIADGHSARYLVPDAVLAYIEEHEIYSKQALSG
jgi:nicotinate-nucleotide adenylyltransferase